MTSEMQAPTIEVGGENLLLKDITVSGEVLSNLASLKIKQKFVNGDRPADVTYHCPLHPDWAVRKVSLKAGDQEISTIVLPKKAAAETFEAAKNEGHTAILAEEVAVDEMRLQLANVPANVDVEVETDVVAWPHVEAGRGEFTIPLINGPRYGGGEEQQAFFDEDDPNARHTSCRLDLKLDVVDPTSDFGAIEDGAISEEIDPVGQVRISFETQASAMWHDDAESPTDEIEWDDEESSDDDVVPDKYLVVGVPVIRSEDDGPKWGNTAMLIDNSGSMSGMGISAAAEMCRRIADRIEDGLKMVYTFGSSTHLIWEEGQEGSLNARDAISHISTGGGTELNAAFKRLFEDMSKKPGQISDVVVVTDALVDYGVATYLVNSINDLKKIGVAVHVILVGPSPGRFIGECMSRAGGGFYIEATGTRFDEEELESSTKRFLSGGLTLRHIEIDGKTIDCPQAVRGRPVMIAMNEVEERPESIRVKFDGVPEIDVPVDDRPEARFVWARERVMEIVREAWENGATYESRADEIEKIGVSHQILTPFTSFVGFDSSKKIDRKNIKEAVAQASLPVGIDGFGFYGVAAGGNLGVGGPVMMRSASFGLAGSTGMSRETRYLCSSRTMSDSWGETSNTVRTSLTEPAFYSPRHTPSAWMPQSMDCSSDLGLASETFTAGNLDLNFDSGVETARLEEMSNIIGVTSRNEAATILERILDEIREKKENGDPLFNLIGDWLDEFGLMAIVIASSALKKAGVEGLADEMAKRAKSGTTIATISERDDVEELAKEIAKELAK